MTNELPSKTLAAIVTENYHAASVFEKYGLDFCCHGKRSLQKACAENNLSLEFLLGEIEASAQQATRREFDRLSLGELADYIVNTHHRYTKSALPQIFSYLQKVSTKHGSRHEELFKIFNDFSLLRQELEQHMLKEELILFPRIKYLDNIADHVDKAPLNVRLPISLMENEHEQVANLLREIRLQSNNFMPPPDACTTYRLSFSALQAFETDLHQHIHLENNILFPKALKLFNDLNGMMMN